MTQLSIYTDGINAGGFMRLKLSIAMALGIMMVLCAAVVGMAGLGGSQVISAAGDPPPQHTITVVVGDNGKASMTGENLVSEGTEVVITFTANRWYKIENVTVAGEDKGSVKTVTIADFTTGVEVTVTFAEIVYEFNVVTLTQKKLVIYGSITAVGVIVLVSIGVGIKKLHKKWKDRY
jgi:hypothetical protein